MPNFIGRLSPFRFVGSVRLTRAVGKPRQCGAAPSTRYPGQTRIKSGGAAREQRSDPGPREIRLDSFDEVPDSFGLRPQLPG